MMYIKCFNSKKTAEYFISKNYLYPGQAVCIAAGWAIWKPSSLNANGLYYYEDGNWR